MQPMTRLAIATAAVALASPLWAGAMPDLTSASEIRAATYDNTPTNRTFDFTATVAYPPVGTALAIMDGSGFTKVHLRDKILKTADSLKAGDKVHLVGGVFHSNDNGNNRGNGYRRERRQIIRCPLCELGPEPFHNQSDDDRQYDYPENAQQHTYHVDVDTFPCQRPRQQRR